MSAIRPMTEDEIATHKALGLYPKGVEVLKAEMYENVAVWTVDRFLEDEETTDDRP